jgi:hypothetical protein
LKYSHATTKTEKKDEPHLPESAQLPELSKKLSLDALVEAIKLQHEAEVPEITPRDEAQSPDHSEKQEMNRKQYYLEALVAARFQRLLEIELSQSSESFRSDDAYHSSTYDVALFHSPSSISLEGNIENHLATESSEEDAHFSRHRRTCSSQDSDLAIAGYFLEPTKDSPSSLGLEGNVENHLTAASTEEDEHLGRYLSAYSSQDTDLAIAGYFLEPTKDTATDAPEYSSTETPPEPIKRGVVTSDQSHICRPSDNMPLAEKSSNALNRRLDTSSLRTTRLFQNAPATMSSEATTDVSKCPVETSETKPTSTITPSANKSLRRIERMRIMQVKKQRHMVSG